MANGQTEIRPHLLRLSLIMWSALASLFMWTALINLEKFAARPAAPTCWLDLRANQAAALLPKLDSETAAAQREDEKRFIWMLMESGQRKQAHDAAAALLPWRPHPSGYDVAYAQRLQLLATAELMHDCASDSLVTLQHLYAYDKEHLAPQDPRLSRDCNNLGLRCFLVGQNSNDESYRYDLFQQSATWLSRAAASFPSSARCDLVSVKENQLMLAEAMKDHDAVERLHHQIDSMLAQLAGPAPLVTL